MFLFFDVVVVAAVVVLHGFSDMLNIFGVSLKMGHYPKKMAKHYWETKNVYH